MKESFNGFRIIKCETEEVRHLALSAYPTIKMNLPMSDIQAKPSRVIGKDENQNDTICNISALFNKE